MSPPTFRSQVDDYTFAVTGETSYVCGSTELIAFKEIRRYEEGGRGEGEEGGDGWLWRKGK